MIDSQQTALYNISTYGKNAVEVQKHGHQIAVFTLGKTVDRNTTDAIKWCDRFYKRIPAGPPAVIVKYRMAIRQRGYEMRFNVKYMAWTIIKPDFWSKDNDICIYMYTEDDAKQAVATILDRALNLPSLMARSKKNDF